MRKTFIYFIKAAVAITAPIPLETDLEVALNDPSYFFVVRVGIEPPFFF
jgi:hypothetical protein